MLYRESDAVLQREYGMGMSSPFMSPPLVDVWRLMRASGMRADKAKHPWPDEMQSAEAS